MDANTKKMSELGYNLGRGKTLKEKIMDMYLTESQDIKDLSEAVTELAKTVSSLIDRIEKIEKEIK